MNPLMIQQAMASARTLPVKASSAAKGGEYETIAQNLLGGGQAMDKDGRDDTANPLAALLLAALFAQPQTQPAPAGVPMTDAGASDTLGALNSLSAQPQTERLTAVLQALGLNADEASAFAAQLADAVQTVRAAGADHADNNQNAVAAVQTGAEDPVAQVRTLLDNLLAGVTDPAVEQSTVPGLGLDVGMAIKLRALLSDLKAPYPAGSEAAVQDTAQVPVQAATQTITPADVAASTVSSEIPAPAIPTVAAAAGKEDQSAASGQDSSDSTGQDASSAEMSAQNAAAAVLPFAASHRVQTAQEPQPRSVTRTLGEAFDTMVDTLSTLRQGPKSEMEIHLKPDFLGKVVIKLTMEEGSLVARISASNAAVQDAFQAQAPQLTSTLQQQGIKDVTVLVAHDAAAGSALDQSTSSRHNQNPREQRRRAVANLDVADKSDAVRAAQAYEQFWRSGTINYLA